MLEINVYKPIDREDVFFKLFGEEDPFSFSADAIHKAIADNPTENEIKININCDGGSVYEGLRIYDVLRTSGKTIYTNIEGSCHSMAIVLLLTASKENRSSNPNARALIHEVRGGSRDGMTAQELRELAESIETEQNTILDIYAERTGYDRTELEILMKEEKVRTANELLKYGFISKINNYNTNKKTNEMSKQDKKGIINRAEKLLSGLKNLLEGQELVNFDFKDADGNILFSTEKEDDSLAVGDAASPDGTFTIEDGRTIVISGGVITEIQEATQNSAEVEELQNEITVLQETVNKLTNSLKEAQTLITDMRNEIGSSYNVAPRQKQIGKQQNVAKTAEDYKNEAREKRALTQGGKK